MGVFTDKHFIEKYAHLYFTKEEYKGELQALGIETLHTTDKKIEDYIDENCLSKGVYDVYALAWKAGRLQIDNGKPVLFCKNEEDCSFYLNGNGSHIKIDEFNAYCKNLNDNKSALLDCVDHGKWNEAYKIGLEKAPKNIGMVNILNALFFISKGKAPIYDKFVHKAVLALNRNQSPVDISLADNPNKTDDKKISAIYHDYMKLLKEVFPDYEFNKGGIFISRELDRALWVYGHSPIKYETEE